MPWREESKDFSTCCRNFFRIWVYDYDNILVAFACDKKYISCAAASLGIRQIVRKSWAADQAKKTIKSNLIGIKE